MNEKEISEIRRRFNKEKSNITHIHGCYVNVRKEIVATFTEPTVVMPEGESEMYLGILKRALSGTLGKNLIDINFSTKQVVDSEEHKLLMELKNSSLKDQEILNTLYQKIIDGLSYDDNYLILIAHDRYDVPFRGKDGGKFEDASSEMFGYILCCICPVKQTKPALSFNVQENEFHNRNIEWLVSNPTLGFMFPSFDDRSTNIYNALYYSKDTAENHEELIDALFNINPPMPAATQKETFEFILGDTLATDCSYDVVQTVHKKIADMIEIHKESKEPEPLKITKSQIVNVFEACGVAEENINSFHEKFDSNFGSDAKLSPKNIVDNKKFEVKTPDIVIKVNPQRSDLIETKIINGRKYLLIDANEGVQVNGVNINIPKEIKEEE